MRYPLKPNGPLYPDLAGLKTRPDQDWPFKPPAGYRVWQPRKTLGNDPINTNLTYNVLPLTISISLSLVFSLLCGQTKTSYKIFLIHIYPETQTLFFHRFRAMITKREGSSGILFSTKQGKNEKPNSIWRRKDWKEPKVPPNNRLWHLKLLCHYSLFSFSRFGVFFLFPQWQIQFFYTWYEPLNPLDLIFDFFY